MRNQWFCSTCSAAAGLACAAALGLSAGMAHAAGQQTPQPPVVQGPAGGTWLVEAPDGAIDMILTRTTGDAHELARRRTTDNGRSWSKPATIMKLPAKNWSTPLALLAQDGELHLFWMVARRRGGKPAVDYFIDIWHARSTDRQTRWTQPKRIFEGYVGSINGMTQLRNGRIVLPFAYWVGGRPEAPPTGANITTTIHSDDGGNTWTASGASLTAPCYENYNGANYGACEPTIIELKDGRVWMLIRTQTGWLYESFSKDGATWSKPRRSRFCSSDSPAYLVRLSDGRIVVFWNNCENTSRINGAGVYTNRDALHAAISDDEGKTWRGCREICRDPFRNDPPPRRGDRGTAYPYATPTKDGKILVVTGQGHGRRNILLIDPKWLCETRRADDFSKSLDGWSVFKAFGPPKGWWRNRTQGPKLIDHPSKAGAKVLHVRRPDEKDGDGAVWNFPVGRRGKLSIRIFLRKGFGGASIALADRFIQPTDAAGEKKVLAMLPIGADGRLPDGVRLELGRWYTISLAWDLGEAVCRVSVDGKPMSVLKMSKQPTPGVCYLRLRSTAPAIDRAGFLVASVEAEVRREVARGEAGEKQEIRFHGIRPTDPGGRNGLRNPERGLRIETLIAEPPGAKAWGPSHHLKGKVSAGYSDDWWVLDAKHYERHGLTLAQTYCYLTESCDRPIPPEKLGLLQRSLDQARKNGLKVLLRFAYEKDTKRRAGPKAQTILDHIDQLAPIIRKNTDIIFVLQAGFVGAWGEWHSATHIKHEDHAALATIVAKVLKVLPSDRMTQVRVPKYKRWVLVQPVLGAYKVVDRQIAHSDLPAARIGFHNDGFLAGRTCGGTWPEPPHYANPGNPEFDTMTAESPFVPVDGELFWSDQSGKVEGLRAAIRMRLHHYTCFSLAHSFSDREGKPFSIDAWMKTPLTVAQLRAARLPVSDGYFRDGDGKEVSRTAFEVIRDHLGYRVELQRAIFPTRVKIGEELAVDVELINRGFSTFHNPRPVYLVLIGPHGEVVKLPVADADPRKWQPHEPGDQHFKPLVHRLCARQALPLKLKTGSYRLGLWMPDAYKTIRMDPRYAVRVANRGVPWWIDAKGRYGINVLGKIEVTH